MTTEFGVTNQRIIVKRGILSRVVKENTLQKIESIQVTQSVMGRFFGFGTIIVRGIGGTPEVFTLINKPLAFRSQVQQQIEQIQNPPKNQNQL